MIVSVPISIGELLDKITILEIKKDRITAPEKLKNILNELELLSTVRDQSLVSNDEVATLILELRKVNEDLWDIEDAIRDCERRRDFGPAFIALARSVYRENDKRSETKNRLNRITGSSLVEEKSYEAY